MEKHKTDESVKAGLQIENDKPLRRKRKRIPLAGNNGKVEEPKEIDVDDVVHEPDFEPTAVFNKENSEAPGENEEKDPDDLVHGK
jgi:hypothetical protein